MARYALAVISCHVGYPKPSCRYIAALSTRAADVQLKSMKMYIIIARLWFKYINFTFCGMNPFSILYFCQIEKSQSANFLFIVGEDDKIGGEIHAKILVDRMIRHHRSRDAVSRCTVLRYPGAGHLIEPPYSPLCRVCYSKLIGEHVSLCHTCT